MIRRYQNERADIVTGISGSSGILADRSFTTFTLLPSLNQPPTIGGQPIDNITQTTWADQLNGELIYQDKTTLFFNNVVNIVEGTAFSISTIANNPAKLNTQEGLTYVWKRNGLILQGSRFENTNTLVFESNQAVIDISGIYTCEVSNQFGTTVTDPVTLKIVNPDTEVLFTKNILQDGSGDANLEEWVQDSDKVRPFEFLDFYTTRGFASVTRNGFFRFSNDQRADEAQSKLIGNDNPSQPYAAFFPSPTLIDNNTRYNLIQNISPYYIGVAPFEYGDRNQYAISQVMPLGDYFDFVDGAAYGIDGCNYELFHYLGAGITKYALSFNGGLEVPSSYQPTDEIFPDSEEYSQDIFDIDLVPAGYDKVDGFIQFTDSEGNILTRDLFDQPSIDDLAAIIKPQITPAQAQELFQLVPNRKVDFTKLIDSLFSFPPGSDPAPNAYSPYWKLPFFRVVDNNVVASLGTAQGGDVYDIECVPAANYTYNVTLKIENRPKPIIIRHKLDGDLTSQYRDREPRLLNTLESYIRNLRLRLLLMEVTLDAVTYGVDITKPTPEEYNNVQTLGTLLCLYFTMITTAAEYESPADRDLWDFSRIRSISNELLGYAVTEQASTSNSYLDVFSKIWRKYAEARGGVNKPGIEEDWLYIVNYLNSDFRFRKLSTLLYGKLFITSSSFRINFGTNNIVVANRLLNELFPRLPFADQRRLTADYFKLIQQDTSADDAPFIPLNINPLTQRLGLFVNASPRIYGSYTAGGAAFFGYNLTGSVPPGSRSANVQYRFTTDINTAIEQPEDWPTSRITLDGYSVYGSPRMGVASSTLIMRPVLTATGTASSFIPIPENNVWYNVRQNNQQLQTIPSQDILNTCRNSVQNYFQTLPTQSVRITPLLPEVQLSPYNLIMNSAIIKSREQNDASGQLDGPDFDPNMRLPTGSYISNGFEIRDEADLSPDVLRVIDSNITTRALLDRYQQLSLLTF